MSLSIPMDARRFRDWLDDRDAPRTLAYHTGRLDLAAETDPAVRELAAAVLHASGQLPPSERPGGKGSRNGDFKQGAAGPALVALTQRRLDGDTYVYEAHKLLPGRRHKEGRP